MIHGINRELEYFYLDFISLFISKNEHKHMSNNDNF